MITVLMGEDRQGSWLLGEELAAMKIALLGTDFGLAHAAVYAERPDVEDISRRITRVHSACRLDHGGGSPIMAA